MSRRPEAAGAKSAQALISVFSALGAAPRLRLLEHLGPGQHRSISALTAGSRLTRQAVSKHLRVLEGAGIVRAVRRGRETLFRLEPDALSGAGEYLDEISRQWGRALGRLKAYVENPEMQGGSRALRQD